MTAAGAVYVDASALVKLVLPEAESHLVADLLDGYADLVSCEIVEVEVRRACERAAVPAARADRVLDRLGLIEVSAPGVRARAAALLPLALRTLDALHLACALETSIDTIVAYDQRLGDAARSAGLRVLAPA